MDVAIALFTRNSVAGTSLQMISDEMGFTKSAIYYHFRTRDELLGAILEPIVERLGELVDDADAQRTPRARADRMLTGYIDLAVANRTLFPIFSGDPGVIEFLRSKPVWAQRVRRQAELLSGAEPGVGGQVKAAVVMGGIATAVGVAFEDLDDAALRHQLLAAARRTLGLRATPPKPS